MTKLQELRLKKSLSQSELSKLSGVNFRTLQDFDQGRKSLSNAKGEMLYRLSYALDCSIDDLLSDCVADIDFEYNDKTAFKNRMNAYARNMTLPDKSWYGKLLGRSKVCYEHTLYAYTRINKNECYLDSCCFHLQQAIEFLLKGIIEMNGLRYSEDHDIRANLNILNRADISIPYEKELRDKAEILYRWETESRYRDSFVAAIRDINEVMECYTVLMNYATENITEIQVSDGDFPDSRL